MKSIEQDFGLLEEAAQQCVYLTEQVHLLAEEMDAERKHSDLQLSGWRECICILSDTDAWRKTVTRNEEIVMALYSYERELRDALQVLTQVKYYQELFGDSITKEKQDQRQALAVDLTRLSGIAHTGRNSYAGMVTALPLEESQWDKLYQEIGYYVPFGPDGGGLGPLGQYLDSLRRMDTQLVQIAQEMKDPLYTLEMAANHINEKIQKEMKREERMQSCLL